MSTTITTLTTTTSMLDDAAPTSPAPSNSEIRTTLFQRLSKAQQIMNKQQIGEVALQIIRFFVKDHHYSQANNFIINTTFPTADQLDSKTFQFISYYTALVKAVFLEYDIALSLLDVLVHASHEDVTEFHIHVYRLYVVVSLLTGSIPDRSLFSQPLVINNMQPIYLQLTQAVRRGEVDVYNEIVSKPENIDSFVADNTYKLILRLPPTIVRAGLKRIITVYSAISLQSIGSLLSIPSDDVHSIVAKAIADGVISATVDENNVVHSKNIQPKYSSTDPQDVLVQRINHTISLRQQCQQALRYPDRQEDDEKTKGMGVKKTMF